MSLRPEWSPPPVHLNVISSRGGLGDNIARLPAYRHMIYGPDQEHVSATIYVQDYVIDLVEYLLPPGPRLSYKKLSTAPWELKKPIIEFDMERLGTLHMHLTDHAFLILMDQMPPNQESRAYPKAPLVNLSNPALRALGPEVVIFTTDFTAESRQWLPVHINTLAKKCRVAGLTPVLLGTTKPLDTGAGDFIEARRDDGIKSDLFIDLRDKTTLIEALGVMQRAKAVVGVDNGLLHLAHCTGTPIVMGLTTIIPEQVVPVRGSWGSDGVGGATWSHENDRWERELTKVLKAQVPCYGCQSRGFAINTDWRECVMPERRYACTLTMTAERFWQALQELGVV